MLATDSGKVINGIQPQKNSSLMLVMFPTTGWTFVTVIDGMVELTIAKHG
jgi:hypothetical protein